MDRNFDRISESAGIDAAFRRAKEEMEPEQLNLEDFRGSEDYTDKEIEKDSAYIQKSEDFFERNDTKEPEKLEARKLGLVFEWIMHRQAELGNWLGPNAVTIKTSKFDDFKNGVDDVVEFQGGESETSHLALAIDTTIGGDSVSKLRRIKEEIDAGQLGEIKYFYSEHTNFKGRLTNVPRVVIGVDGTTIGELTNLWMSGDKKALNTHKIQFQILKEIILQAETFRDYALRIGKDGVAGVYGNLAVQTRKIYEEKAQETGVKTDDFDSAYNALKFNLKIFES